MLDRFINQPLALWPGHAAVVLELLQAQQLRGGRPIVAFDGAAPDNRPRPYDLIAGVAIIPIRGVLVHSPTWWFDETDYGSIANRLIAAIEDPEVRGIALHVNSPGGEVCGCFDLADAIYALRGAKPIWSILDECAYSAAYALACAADRIIVPKTGGTGSIGVVAMHLDVTKALEDFGLKVTTFQFGERKTDSYPTTPLSDEAKTRFQADVDTLGEMFVDLVARNRKLGAAKVRETQAATFLGAEGVERGLADAVMAPDEAFMALVEAIS